LGVAGANIAGLEVCHLGRNPIADAGRGEWTERQGTRLQWCRPFKAAAVDVLMEDGRLELFWLPNLNAVEEDIAV
jgi:hypothetical protein